MELRKGVSDDMLTMKLSTESEESKVKAMKFLGKLQLQLLGESEQWF